MKQLLKEVQELKILHSFSNSDKKTTKSDTKYINHKHQIESEYASLISLIDTIYPPSTCTLCDATFISKNASESHFLERHRKTRRYLCIHPNCQLRFASKGGLYFHIHQSHLVFTNPTDLSFQIPLMDTSPVTPIPTNHSPSPPSSPPPLPPPPVVKKSPLPLKETFNINNKTTVNTRKPITVKPTIPSPFSLYQNHRSSKKSNLSSKAEQQLNSIYPPLQCPCCDEEFNKKTHVIKHLTDAHLGQEPYRCIYSKCNHPRAYATREGLVYHIVRFHDELEKKGK